MNQAEIDSRFTYHPPTDEKQTIYTEIRSKAKALAEYIATNAPTGRETSLSLTNLEQAVMWANAGVARS
jgi:hypothetical protein